MLLHRTVSGLVVTALVGLGPVVMAAEANAALPDRKVTAKVVEPKPNKLVLKGRVTPDYANKKVIIQKRNCLKKSCDWKKFRAVETNKDGKYRGQITAPRQGYDYWRAKVHKSGGYGTSLSEVWRTYTV